MNMGGGIYRLERGPLHFLCMCSLCGCELSCFPFTFIHTCFIISTIKHTNFLPMPCAFLPLCMWVCCHVSLLCHYTCTHTCSLHHFNHKTHTFSAMFLLYIYTHTCFIISTTKHTQFLPMPCAPMCVLQHSFLCHVFAATRGLFKGIKEIKP